jgi:hypothetical protein
LSSRVPSTDHPESSIFEVRLVVNIGLDTQCSDGVCRASAGTRCGANRVAGFLSKSCGSEGQLFVERPNGLIEFAYRAVKLTSQLDERRLDPD